jgi:hypothetical protein
VNREFNYSLLREYECEQTLPALLFLYLVSAFSDAERGAMPVALQRKSG